MQPGVLAFWGRPGHPLAPPPKSASGVLRSQTQWKLSSLVRSELRSSHRDSLNADIGLIITMSAQSWPTAHSIHPKWSCIRSRIARLDVTARSIFSSPVILNPRKRRHSRWKLSQKIKWKIINFLAKMANRKKDTYQIKPRTYVLFRLCFNWMMNGKSLKNQLLKKCCWLPPWLDGRKDFSQEHFFNHYISKPDAAKITKRDVDMYHVESYFRVKRSNINITRHKIQCRGFYTLVSAGFFQFLCIADWCIE